MRECVCLCSFLSQCVSMLTYARVLNFWNLFETYFGNNITAGFD